MEDRALRGRHSHWAFVTQATAVVINNGTLHGSKYNHRHPYRAMTSLRDESPKIKHGICTYLYSTKH